MTESVALQRGLKKGEHKLIATVDPKSAVAESDEGNNDLEVAARRKDDD
jgi:subtilase family serine protease